ncbi:hypothetical protein ILUMI_04898 [Ignelater luminosus]|uniref:Uncharacterized protein n=1 Tax=Ignelater luminosus TaxID=2038154 RepID=A0A8K0GIM1_IGNLU|nr:hypothetical protein ILUMI_04898 [Ignelater luminosus]
MVKYPFQLISVDLTDPLPRSTKGILNADTGFTPSFLNFGRSVPCHGDYCGKLNYFKPTEVSLDSREQLVKDVNQLSPLYIDIQNPVVSDASKGFAKNLAFKLVKAKVAEVTGSVTYRLVNLHDKNLNVWHVIDLKPHHEEVEDDRLIESDHE